MQGKRAKYSEICYNLTVNKVSISSLHVSLSDNYPNYHSLSKIKWKEVLSVFTE
jgi:hypothetical protein